MLPSILFIQSLLAATSFAYPNLPPRAFLNETLASRQSFPVEVQAGGGGSIGHTANTVTTLLWSGAGYSTAVGAPSWNSVSVTAQLPAPKMPPSLDNVMNSVTHSASVVVAIDGLNCPNSLFQAGVMFSINGQDNSVSYNAWYQWGSNFNLIDPGQISFSALHEVTIQIAISSFTSGTALFTNHATNVQFPVSLTNQVTLCGREAHWIVQSLQFSNQPDAFGHSQGGPVPLADFGTIKLTAPLAVRSTGDKYGPNGAQTLDIQQNGKTLTSTTLTDSDVTVVFL